MDDLARKRLQLFGRGASLVAGLCAYMTFVLRRAREQTPGMIVGTMAERAVARESNLRYIYHSSDINCSNQLRITRAQFFHLCTAVLPLEIESCCTAATYLF